jgi:hypothetical protein
VHAFESKSSHLQPERRQRHEPFDSHALMQNQLRFSVLATDFNILANGKVM